MNQVPCHYLGSYEWSDIQSRLRTCKPNERKVRPGKFIIATARDSLVEGLSVSNSRNVNFVPHDLADVFPALIAVEVSRCSIETVDENQFKNLWKLRLLSLSRNKIDFVSVDAFNDLNNLEHLYLAFNRIRSLEAFTFDALRNLKELSLYENRIQCLHPEIFYKLGSVKEIWLSKNRIRSLDEFVFKKQSKLSHIALNGNKMVEIPEKLFENNLKLEEIWLHDNKIDFIAATMFDNLPYLEVVALEHNSCVNRTYEAAILNVLRQDLTRHCMEPFQLPEESRQKCQTIPVIEVDDNDNFSEENTNF